MKTIKQLVRLIQISYIFAKHGFDKVLVSMGFFSWMRYISYFNPWNWFRKAPFSRGEAIRNAFEELGPIFIKFGQALSTRPDILPADIAAELSKLQDRVTPFSAKQAVDIVEQSFGRPVYEVFAEFDATALASASIAQVHAATLLSGEDVVVKLLRPNIAKIIEKDLSVMRLLAKLASRFWIKSKQFKPKEIVHEFESNLTDELDLHREAANSTQIRRNFKHSPLLYVPEIYWDYVRENVLVSERVYGIPINDLNALRRHGVNMKKLAERGLDIFFTQVFRDCFFHADMHPGNIFVSTDNPEEPKLICVDFGIVGSLNDNDKRYLGENLIAFFNRNYRRVAELHLESGWISNTVRIGEFENAIRTVCEPIFEKPLKNISVAVLVLSLFQVARRYEIVIQPQLVLLQKTLFAIEGLGRNLYPELDLWATAKPFLEKWLREQIGPKAFLHHLRENIPFFVEQLPYLPKLVNDVLLLAKHNYQRHDEILNTMPLNKPKSKHVLSFVLGVVTTAALFFILFR